MVNLKKTSLWISSQYYKHLRVWKLLKKPSMKEFKMISKVSALGLLIIGAIGFAISIVINLFLG